MWETIIAVGLFLLLLLMSWLVYGKATGKWEYKRFLREMRYKGTDSVPIRAEMEDSWPKGKFLRGVIYFDGGTKAFHFTNERAFQRAADKYKLRVFHSKLARPAHR